VTQEVVSVDARSGVYQKSSLPLYQTNGTHVGHGVIIMLIMHTWEIFAIFLVLLPYNSLSSFFIFEDVIWLPGHVLKNGRWSLLVIILSTSHSFTACIHREFHIMSCDYLWKVATCTPERCWDQQLKFILQDSHDWQSKLPVLRLSVAMAIPDVMEWVLKM